MSRFANLEFEDVRGRALATPACGIAVEQTRDLEAAGERFRAGYFETALRLYGQAVERDPRRLPARVGLVRMLLELGRLPDAGRHAERALEQFPEAPELLALKGVILARAGDPSGALAFSDAAMQGAEPTPAVWLALGEVLLARGEKRADYCFAKALAAAPADWFWSWLATRAHLAHRRFVRALGLARQALTLESGAAVIWTQLGRCQLALGLMPDARQALVRAEQLDAACPETRSLREALGRAGPWQRGIGAWRRLWQV